MDESTKVVGCIINLLSSSHPHFKSLLEEGLWGFPDNDVNRKRWEALRRGVKALLYFEHNRWKGVWGVAEVTDVFRSREPVRYWVENPTGYPLQVKLKLLQPVVHAPTPHDPLPLEVFDRVRPLGKEELAVLGVRVLKPVLDRWSLLLFGEGKPATYSVAVFERALNEFTLRNTPPKSVTKPSHDDVVEILEKIGQLQGKIVEREVEIEGKRIDLAWKKLPKAVPHMVFEVSIGGDLYADLMKLKHAVDLWNSIAVLVTTSEKKEEALNWLGGALHEVRQYFRVVTIDEVIALYERKKSYKELESKMGLL